VTASANGTPNPLHDPHLHVIAFWLFAPALPSLLWSTTTTHCDTVSYWQACLYP
jgi:hypothetical protein